jgi:hypothetical protein
VRLLLDEQLSPTIAEQLRGRNHDVVSAIEVRLSGLPDEQVLSSATIDQRAVVTNNIRDFRPMQTDYLKTNRTHYGIVLVPTPKYSLRRDRLGPLITALHELLVQSPADNSLEDREHFL